ncbi:hypothetical protein E3N88_37946 [Mikania micrantha]|uniref:Uncharacterized protein n=1 Tax=Mikania micrantha TaxID=192012 RepID=A0A5N6LSQ4_9ASTR|nr:hypothetical protein E3N88_37946 [Mikania micrantha]
MLFDEATFALIGITADDLLTRSFTEGVDDPYWIHDFFFDTLLARRVIIKIKIDRYNLAPNYVHCFTVSKYIGDDINLLNKDKTMSTASASQVLPSNDVVSDGDVDDTIDNYPKITDDEWALADESMWTPLLHQNLSGKGSSLFLCDNNNLFFGDDRDRDLSGSPMVALDDQ